MPAEQNHQEKCSFTWKVGVLTWESCDGFCRGKTKAGISEGNVTQQAPGHIPVGLQWPGGAGVWLCPTGTTGWEQHRDTANLSQDWEKPGPSWGPNRHKKL